MWQVPLEMWKEKTECSFLQTDALVYFTEIFMNWLQLSELRTWTIRWNLEKCSRKSGCLFVGKWSFIIYNIYRTRGERYSSAKREILFLSFIFIHSYTIHMLLDFFSSLISFKNSLTLSKCCIFLKIRKLETLFNFKQFGLACPTVRTLRILAFDINW